MGHRDGMTTSHEPLPPTTEAGPDPHEASVRLADWGFLANPDLPDQAGPGYLLVALRSEPTLRHYDPESVEYWATDGGRGTRRTLQRTTTDAARRRRSRGVGSPSSTGSASPTSG